jgi:hypothetical protein
MKSPTKIVLLVITVALASGVVGFYAGLRQGSYVMGTLASQNRIFDALRDVRTTVPALEKNEPSVLRQQVAVQLRVALFALDAYSGAVPFWKCSDQDKEALLSASAYIGAHSDARVFNSGPPLVRGAQFCKAR